MQTTDDYIRFEDAAELIGKNVEQLRSIVRRHDEIPTQKYNHRVMIHSPSIQRYWADKYKLPFIEDVIQDGEHEDTFIHLEDALELLQWNTKWWLIRIARRGLLRVGVTADGQILVSKESIEAYLNSVKGSDDDELQQNDISDL